MKRLRMKKRFNENIHRPDVEDLDVPVTEEEEVLARYIEQCIKEELGIGSSCETHNPGEEMHIEIFIGEDEYDENTDLNELCADLEKLVNQIGKQEKYDSGTEWGDASFSPQGDYIFGEVWPLEGEYAINPKGELARESTRRARRSARRFNERTAMTAKEAEKQLRAIGDNDPDSIIWILGDILRGVAENCDETLAYDIVNSVNEPKLAQLTMAIFQDIWDGRLNDGDYED
jgi:hypothetical protein